MKKSKTKAIDSKSKIKCADELMGKLKVVSDFLPSPDQLVLKANKVKVR
jgi:hypothetical protein